MSKKRELIYGTCVAWGNRAALLRGRSSSGKSDLALRFLALSPEGKVGEGAAAHNCLLYAITTN